MADNLPTLDVEPVMVIANDHLKATILQTGTADRLQYYLAAVQVKIGQVWQTLLTGAAGSEFVTSWESINALSCAVRQTPAGEPQLELAGQGEGWEARETITLLAGQPALRREQTYHFKQEFLGAVSPGLRLAAGDDLRYTYAVQAHEQPLAVLPRLRKPADWAVPFPFHVWHNRQWVGLYGLDKSISPGTIEFIPPASDGAARLRVFYPDTEAGPDQAQFSPGHDLTLVEIVAARGLAPGEAPLLEAERIAAAILLREPPRTMDFAKVAGGIAAYYDHCGLWEPDGLGPGRGWFTNMWVRTQTGPAKKRGEYTGYYDLGWGEGNAVEMWHGMVRHWQRTGLDGLLHYVDEMTRNMDLFKRGGTPDAPYFDRSDGVSFGDFVMSARPDQRIWTHALGHTGSQLVQLYQAAPGYPDRSTREKWLEAALSMARFLASRQMDNGDLQDGFDEQDREINDKPHRITARAVVCGLWARLAPMTGDQAWTERALRLAKAAAPEIERYEYYNQMIDTCLDPKLEAVDGEAAYYALEGLAPLYSLTRDAEVLALCQEAAAFGIAWTYFYNLPNANRGIARGGQVCRTDIPLLYAIGPAKGIGPLLELARATSDPFYEQMASEAAAFISNWQMDAPGQPWDGGMVHALMQHNGKHWGPDLAGQVDTGMATGNSLAAIELWLEHQRRRHAGG